MKRLNGKSTLLVALILGLHQFPLGLPAITVPKTSQGILPRVEPIFKSEPVSPVSPKPASGEPAAAKPVPKFGDTAPANPANPVAAPPRFGGDPAAVAGPAAPVPLRATLGTEEELVAMELPKGSAKRTAFDKFSAWFDSNVATKTSEPWLFFTKLGTDGTSPTGLQLVPKFQDEFNRGLHRIDSSDSAAKITYIGEKFPIADLKIQLGPSPRNLDEFWYDMISSYGAARVAATAGGKVRLLMPKTEKSNAPDGRFWTSFEAYELTKPGSKVTEIWRYNSDDFKEAPVRIWRQGDAPIGEPVRFSEEFELGQIEIRKPRS